LAAPSNAGDGARAGRRECECEVLADSATGSGDERHLPIEIEADGLHQLVGSLVLLALYVMFRIGL
jgi:hypothetical protein